MFRFMFRARFRVGFEVRFFLTLDPSLGTILRDPSGIHFFEPRRPKATSWSSSQLLGFYCEKQILDWEVESQEVSSKILTPPLSRFLLSCQKE